MSNLSEEEQAMMLFQMFQSVMGDREGGSEEEEDDDRVVCPVCSKAHEPKEGEEEAAKKGEPASHGCLVVYIAHQCPICLEDPAGPPMIALPCGHLICQDDFQKLGGYLGEKPSDRPSTGRPRRSRSGGDGMDPSQFISGLNMMRMIGMPPFGFPPGFGGESEEEDDDYDEDDDDESCPPLERVGGNNDGNNDSDDSMPPLEPVRRAGGNNEADDSDDDSQGSMPELQRMDGGVASDDDEEEEEANDEDSMPSLMPRAVESDVDSSDDDMPTLASRSRSSNAARNDRNGNGSRRASATNDDDDDDDMPGLLAGAASDSDSEDDGCPALERVDIDSSDEERPRGRPNAATGGGDDDDSMPSLTRRGGESESEAEEVDQEPPPLETVAGQESDDDEVIMTPPAEVNKAEEAGEISEVDEEEEEEEEIPFPVLDRVRGASRAPTTFTREEYLALPEEQRNLGAGGAWIMIPSAYNEDYSTLVYTNDVKCVHIGVFARESRLIVNDNKSIFICSPKSDSNQSDVWHVNLEASERKYEVPSNAQCVSDGDGGVWALTPTGGTKELSYYSVDSPSGSVVHMLPESSYIVMDPMGGVWAHVRKRGTADVEPGLYYYVFGMGHNLISMLDQDSKCTPGADGVCVVTTVGGQVQLSNIVLGETARPVTLKNCAASKDIRVVPREKEEGDRALYVHCRVKNRWKLCLLDESGRLSDMCDCPKDARVVGDGKGGAWIFKRTGASHQMRMLTFVTSSCATRDHGLSFPPGSKIAGL